MYALLALAVGAAAFGSRVINGGRSTDDWAWAAQWDQHRSFSEMLAIGHANLPYRPGSTVTFAAAYWLFGLHGTIHLAAVLVMNVVMVTALYTLLRASAIGREHAAIIGLLVLLAPYSDATRLWSGTLIIPIAVTAFLVGAVVAVRGSRAPPRHRAAWHGVALACWTVSLLTYEACVALIGGSIVLYLWVMPWRAALTRWLADVAVVGIVVAAFTLHDRPSVNQPSVTRTLGNLSRFAADAYTLTPQVVFPGGALPRWSAIVLAMAAICAGLLVIAREPASEPARTARRWLAVMGSGLFVVAAGYLPYTAAEFWVYPPSGGGLFNRVNAVPSIGFALAAYSCVVLIATAATSLRPAWSGALRAGAVATGVALVAAYAAQAFQDARLWNRAGSLQDDILEVADEQLPDLPAGARIFLFEHPVEVDTGVVVFGQTWDLTGALRIERDDPSIVALPMTPGFDIVCDDGEMRVYDSGGGHHPEFRNTYDGAYALSFQRQEVVVIDDAQTCRDVLATFRVAVWISPV